MQVVEDPGGLNYTTNYSYDALGDLTGVNQSGQTRTFVYDSLGRLVQAANPESGTVSYGYDNAGNQVSRTDNRGITSTTSYDALNRALKVTYSDGTSTVSYSYDPSVANGVGHLGSVSNTNAVVSFTGFNALGQVTASSQVTGGQTYGFSYGYDLAGSLTSETYPSGRVITTGYDGAERTAQVTGSISGQQTNYLSQLVYAPQGAPTQYCYGNSLCRQLSYNNRLQLGSTTDMLNNSPSNTLQSVGYNWGTTSNNGTLQGAAMTSGGPGSGQTLSFSQTFGYDHVNRLLSASDSGGWSRSFGYDAFGNMWLTGNTGVPQAGNTRATRSLTFLVALLVRPRTS